MKRYLIIWADHDPDALPHRAEYKERGIFALIRTGRHFNAAEFEPAAAVTFLNCSNQEEISEVYAQRGIPTIALGDDLPDEATEDDEDGEGSEGYLDDSDDGQGEVNGEGGGEEQGASSQTNQNDPLANMTDADLRTYVEGVTGVKAHHAAGRKALMRQLAAHNGEALPQSNVQTTDSPFGQVRTEYNG